MAINPSTQYPGKVDTSDPTGYPYGKAQNVTVPGDGTGTPWEQAFVNDLFGFSQALMSETGTVPSGTPDKVGASQLLGAVQGLKRKNYIVNPSMAISQENGDGPTVLTPGVSRVYGADEWASGSSTGSGCELTITRELLAGFKSYKAEVTSPATDITSARAVQGALQIIEGNNAYNLNNKAVSLSMTIRTNVTGKLAVAVVSGDASRSYVHDVDVVSGENEVSFSLEMEASTVAQGSGAGLSVRVASCNEGDFQTATTDTWQSGLFLCSDQSTQWVKTAGNYVEITAVKLEEGSVDSVFEPNGYWYDLEDCLPYFERILNPDIAATYLPLPVLLRSSTEIRASLSYSQKRTSTPVVSIVGDYSLTVSTITYDVTLSVASVTDRYARLDSTGVFATSNSGLLSSRSGAGGGYFDINDRL